MLVIDQVEVGDILDEIDGANLFGVTPETISKIVKKKGGRIPIRYQFVEYAFACFSHQKH